MTERPFGPLDQYQPFVDEFGRITPEWYSWLGLLCNELNRLRDIEARVAAIRQGQDPEPPRGVIIGGIDG